MRKHVPGLVTYITLSCGVMAIIQTFLGNQGTAGVLVLSGYILDAVDGEIARRLKVTSSFGLQMDSLVDIVIFGVAAPLLVFQHLQDSYLPWWLIWIGMLTFSMAAVFRLARFNLHANGGKPRDTIGLTISTSGAYLTLSVLADNALDVDLIPDWSFLLILFILALLMISRIRFPELTTILSRRILSLILLGTAIVAAIWLTPQFIWFVITTGYIAFGLGRAAYRIWT